MPADKENYIIVNIWTSRGNDAIPGVNVSHASLTHSEGHICLWPEAGDNYKPESSRFFKPVAIKPKNSYLEPMPGNTMNYESECMREVTSENAQYELSLLGYELCSVSRDTVVGENKLYVTPAYAYSFALMQNHIQKDTVYFKFHDNLLHYSYLDSLGQRITGAIGKPALEVINAEFAQLAAPFTTEQLQLIEQYYSDILNLLPENHRVILGEVLLQYTVIAPFKKTVTEKIKERVCLDNGNDLLAALLTNELDEANLQLFLPALLRITLKKGHTLKAHQSQIIEKNKIYVDLKVDGSLQYTVITPCKKEITSSISSDLIQLMKHRGESLKLKAPLTIDQLAHLEKFLFNILEETFKKGHTKRMLVRPVSDLDELYEDDTVFRYDEALGYEPCLMSENPYVKQLEKYKLYFLLKENGLQYFFKTRFNEVISSEINDQVLKDIGCNFKAPLTLTQLNFNFLKIMEIIKKNESIDTKKTYAVWNESVPEYVNERYSFKAIKLVRANFRMVLYSLRTHDIVDYLECLRENGITGWKMMGSNMFSYAFNSKTPESCSSIIYRCLNAGGLLENLSSQVSRMETPENLLRCIVATKERELKFYPETRNWKTIEGESSLVALKSAYSKTGVKANCAEDKMPSIIPTNPFSKYLIP